MASQPLPFQIHLNCKADGSIISTCRDGAGNLLPGPYAVAVNASFDAARNSLPGSTTSITPPGTAAVPSLTITMTGGDTTQAQQTIMGTIDVADVSVTVTVKDNGQPSATTVPASDGTWSASITMA